MALDMYDFYDKIERNNIMLSFKGDVTSELLTSVLQIMETKLDNLQEEPRIKKKVYNVLVESLQNLYHHLDEVATDQNDTIRSAFFMIGKIDNQYNVVTGNYIYKEYVEDFKNRLENINLLSKEELKEYYKSVLNNGEISKKGGVGLGMVDIARKTGEKLDFNFSPVDDLFSLFTLNIKIAQ
jgi:hypothetical protein